MVENTEIQLTATLAFQGETNVLSIPVLTKWSFFLNQIFVFLFFINLVIYLSINQSIYLSIFPDKCFK